VAYSSTEAEFCSLGDAAKEAKFTQNFWPKYEMFRHQLSFTVTIKIENSQHHRRTKYADVHHHVVRNAVHENIVRVKYRPT
jgi:hypothetical protein